MVEATERLVGIYLESKGFLVKFGYTVKVAKRRILEADIIAARLVNQQSEDLLPNKIIGEVKSWQLTPACFPASHKKAQMKSRAYYNKFKIINNGRYRKTFLKNIEGHYGNGFEFCIFAKKEQPKHKQLMEETLKALDVKFISLEKVAEDIMLFSKSKSYSNDPELQLMRLVAGLKK